MRIGLIADIHGNAFALRAALAALDRLGVDRILCLGDVATPGPWPAETIHLLMERRIESVRGNTDEWLLARNPAAVSDIPSMNAVNVWATTRLGPAGVAWLRALPMHRTYEIEGTSLLLSHGSPRSTTEVIAATTPADALMAMFDGVPGDVRIGGHTHVQLLRNAGCAVYVNPGSVGLGGTGPGTPDLPPSRPAVAAELAVLEIAGGSRSVAFHRLPLDIPGMLSMARGAGMPEFDGWASLWASP
jgi:putative phosphoesterase